MQDMIVMVQIPSEIIMPNNTFNATTNKTSLAVVNCSSLYGVALDLVCVYNSTNRTLILLNAFPYS